MGMISQDLMEIQELTSNVLRGIPAAITSGNRIFILFKELSEELEQFISTGRTGSAQLDAISREDMEAVAECCERNGLTLKYRNLYIEYMHRKIVVICPQVSAPATRMRVMLIPWFAMQGRPYPVFTYIYALLRLIHCHHLI